MTRIRTSILVLAVALACALPAAALAGAPTKRVSISSAGVEADLSSSDVSISADGRFVAFQSNATTLVPHDTNGFSDVFVRDRKTGTTYRVSVATGGAQSDAFSGNAEISADGRFVVFASDATNLVPGDTNGRSDIFIRDRKTKTTRRVSISSAGVQADDHNYDPSVSATGRFVVWETYAKTLVAKDTDDLQHVYLRDRKKGITRRISIGIGGAIPDGHSSVCSGYGPAISADGTYVAFASEAKNLVPNDTKGKTDVFVRNWRTGVTRRVTVSSAGAEGDIGRRTARSPAAEGSLPTNPTRPTSSSTTETWRRTSSCGTGRRRRPRA